MKKIGIMTHHKFYNQGTMLQAYALQRKIELMGKNSEIINYTTQNFRLTKKEKVKNIVENPKLLLDRFILKLHYIKNKSNILLTKQKYDDFYNENIKVSIEKYSEENLKESLHKYTIFMVGSDQTWNPYIKSNKETYLLDFVPNNKVKVSYAPSIGGREIPKKFTEIYKKNLESYNYISCREEKGKQILEQIIDKKIEVVVDPTLLLNKSEWEKVASKYESKNNEKYILCYFLGRNKKNVKIAKKIAKDRKLPILSIYSMDSGKLFGKNTKFGVGPSEFITLIKNAELICTDSFHGCVFSIIFNKQFFAFKKRKDKKGSDNNRLIDLLSKFNIKDRIDINPKLKYEDINYENVNKIVEKEKKRSEEFLQKCIDL